MLDSFFNLTASVNAIKNGYVTDGQYSTEHKIEVVQKLTELLKKLSLISTAYQYEVDCVYHIRECIHNNNYVLTDDGIDFLNTLTIETDDVVSK